MVRKVFGLLIGASLGIAVTVVPAGAHHAFAAAFDANALVTVQGVITEVKLVNPHSWVMIDVTDANVQVVHWEFEGQTPTGPIRTRMRPNFINPRDKFMVKDC